ncbi:MAG: SlyX family protein [Thioalkalispiraceae bacterium]|jgi:SlyX protein
MTDRVTELETQLAFQESTIHSLNEVVTDQQRQIDELREQLRQIKMQLQSLAETVHRPESDEPPPPHY